MISAEEAQRIGLVNHVYEPGELLAAAQSLAKKIAANAPVAVQLTMEAIERGLGNAAGTRLVSGSFAVWHELRDRRYARRHAGISRKARGAISRQMSNSS